MCVQTMLRQSVPFRAQIVRQDVSARQKYTAEEIKKKQSAAAAKALVDTVSGSHLETEQPKPNRDCRKGGK